MEPRPSSRRLALDGEDPSGTAFRDVIFLAMAVFVAIVVMLLPHLNPDGKRQSETTSCPQGDMIVEAQWMPGDIDVDLWVRAPGDVPVGYSNKGGVVFNLLRDDIGLHGDFGPANIEMSVARFTPPGIYTINVHMYRNSEAVWPVTGAVRVSTCDQDRGVMSKLVEKPFTITKIGTEMTIFGLELDEDKTLVPGSVNSIQVPLRSRNPNRERIGGM